MKNSGKFRNGVTAAGVGAASVAGGYLAFKYGASDLLDRQIVPQPETFSDVVSGIVAVNEGLRTAAPVVGFGMFSAAAYFAIAGKLNKKEKTLNKLAKTEYSGVEDISHIDRKPGNTRERVRKLQKGIGVAALGALLTMSVSGVEKDITNGSLRPIDAVTSRFVSAGENYHMLLQSEHNTFMDTSSIPKKRPRPSRP